MDYMKSYDIMMADSSDDDDDDDDEEDDDDDDYDDEDENCPSGCHCSPRVVQCSDKGQETLMCGNSVNIEYAKTSFLLYIIIKSMSN